MNRSLESQQRSLLKRVLIESRLTKAFWMCALVAGAQGVSATWAADAPTETAAPQAEETSQAARAAELQRLRSQDPLVGVVINRTITVLGREFYQYFAATWRDKELSERYSVTVYERPTAIRGSEMWVQYGNKRVYHTYLSPSRSAAKDISRKAVEIVYKNIVDLDVQQLLFQDEDLGPEEI